MGGNKIICEIKKCVVANLLVILAVLPHRKVWRLIDNYEDLPLLILNEAENIPHLMLDKTEN